MNDIASFVNTSPDGILFIDRNNCISRMNPAFEALFGWTSTELLGEQLHQAPMINGKWRSDSEQLIQTVRTTGKVMNYITKRMHKTGADITVSISAFIVVDECGDPTELVYVYRDMSEMNDDISHSFHSVPRTREQILLSLYEHYPDGIVMLDATGSIIGANRAQQEMLGYTEQEFKQLNYHTVISERDIARVNAIYKHVLEGESVQFTIEVTTKHGNALALGVMMNPMLVDESIVGVFAISRELTELHEAINYREESELRYRSLIDLSHDPIVVHSGGVVSFLNPAAVSCFGGQGAEDFIGKSVLDFVHPDDHFDAINRIKEVIASKGKQVSWLELNLLRLDGSSFEAETNGTPIMYENKLSSMLIVRDVTERKKTERLIEHMAYHDSLTGLPNRVLFSKLVTEQLANSGGGTLFFVDLDRFKLINDTLGHHMGDQLLKQVANRLCASANGLYARQGGDEFTVFYANMDQDGAVAMASELIRVLSEPYEVEGHELFITPSIGISMCTNHSEDVEALIRMADVALYFAKEKGRNTHIFYSDEMNEQNTDKMQLGNQLRKALEKDEFILHYQPRYDIRFDKLVGMEALIRWNHPFKGLLSPDKFIPLSEEMGLIVRIGEWVLRTACQQAKCWLDEGHPIIVSVNISGYQFHHDDIVSRVKNVLIETALPPSLLNLEVTESLPIIDFDSAVDKLNQLRSLGVEISLDDFGTGYSSLNYLRRLPFDVLKIDKSFIKLVMEDEFHSNMVLSIISLAHILGKRVVAEGIETEEHLKFLRTVDCDEAQGFLLSRPQKAEDLYELIQKKSYE